MLNSSIAKKTALWACGFVATLSLISTIGAQQPRGVDANLLKTAGTTADTMPGTWLTYGLSMSEQRYSQLKQIDSSNVTKLGLAWSAPLTAPGGRGGERDVHLQRLMCRERGQRELTCRREPGAVERHARNRGLLR